MRLTTLLMLLIFAFANASAQESAQTQSAKLIDLQEELRQLEGSFNAYDPAIAEKSLEIGNSYRLSKFYDAALQSYERALGIEKINNGLYHPSVLAIYDVMLETALESGKFESAAEFATRLGWANNQTFEQDDLARAEYLVRAALFHLSAYTSEINDKPLQHLKVGFEQLNEYQTLMLENNQRPSIELQRKTLFAATELSNYLEAQEPESYGSSYNTIHGWTSVSDGRTLEMICDRPVPQPMKTSSSFTYSNDLSSRGMLDNAQLIAYLNSCDKPFDGAKSAISKELIESARNDPESLLFIADWHLIEHEYESALEYYNLAASAKQELGANNLSGYPPVEPINLAPDLVVFERSDKTIANSALFVFDISKHGEVDSRVELLADDESLSATEIRNQKSTISDRIFRPRISEAGFEAIDGFECYWDADSKSCSP